MTVKCVDPEVCQQLGADGVAAVETWMPVVVGMVVAMVAASMAAGVDLDTEITDKPEGES